MAPGYIIVCRPPASCGVYASAPNSTTSTGQGDIPISSTGCTCFLIDGSVDSQYVTKRNIYIYRYIYPRSTKSSLWFKNAFTFGCWCHSNRFLMLCNHTGMVAPRAFHSCWNPFYIRRLFGLFSFSFIFFMRYCTKALQINVIYNSAERCYLLINGALKMGGEQKESS